MDANKKARQVITLPGLENTIGTLHCTPQHAPAARNVLGDAVTSAGLKGFVAMAVLSAAESYAKACMRDQFAALVVELERGPGGVA